MKSQALLAAFLMVLSTPNIGLSIDEFKDVKTIRSIPMTKSEVDEAHRRSRVDACEILPDGESLEQTSFSLYLTDRDRRQAQRGGITAIPTARHSLLSVGLEIDAVDRISLPTLSGRQILDYLDENFVIVQARVRRDLLDRKLYYHHRPIAVTAQYRGSKLTQKFEAVVANSVRDFHSLGVFRKSDSRIVKPEELRTLVLLFRNTVQTSKFRSEDRFEFAFVRGRESKDPNRLDNHVFITDNERTELVYLESYLPPSSVRTTTVRGSVLITSYDSTGIFPKESITKSYNVTSRKRFKVDEIEDFAREHSLVGGWSENLDTVLDAIIDGKLTSSESALP